MKNVTVSIGRNIGENPMSDAAWDDFREGVFQACENAGEIHFFGDGVGVYEGKEEESYTVTLTLKDEYDITLLRHLSDYCIIFEQDCIAVTWGETDFVKPGLGWMNPVTRSV